MGKNEKMEELFERLPWLQEEFEIEQEIIEQQVMAEREYSRVFEGARWAEHLD